MSDGLVSRLRTWVPYAWGAALAWLVGHGLPTGLADALGPLGEAVLYPLAALGVYELARRLEAQSWAPAWLVRLLLGSTRQPTYPAGPPTP